MRTAVFCERCSGVVIVEYAAGQDAACPDCGDALRPPAACDVFISYATPDLEVARQVGAALAARNINYWLAPERIEVGDSFLTKITADLAEANVVALILSRAATKSPWVRAEVTLAISAGTAVLPLKVEEFDLPREFVMLLAHANWMEAYRGGVGSYIEPFVSKVQEKLRDSSAIFPAVVEEPATPAPQARPKLGVKPHQSPYVGPQPFPRQMAGKFFGRHHEAAEILKQVAAHRIVLIYAPSGAGKSSLLNTLIQDSLEQTGLEVLLGARVGGALPDHVKAADIRNIYTFSAVCGIEGAALPSPKCRLSEALAARHVRAGVRGRAVIFDQFEELFTQHAERFEDRHGFFEDVVTALREDPGLRVVFAMRQEYLADIDPLADELPDEFKVKRFALRRLDQAGALEAITGPAADYADFAPGVAEEIVRQLNTIRVAGFDGVVVEKRGEFIEMVHLQIVCARLWDALPAGVTVIERAHVERAAGAGKSFNEFVVNALDAFYDDTVEKVANSKETRAAGGFPKELIRLGCMKFVTNASTRTMVQRKNDRTGRLPDWIVEQLEKSHLLRFETRGGIQWYELSHDRLADPVGRQINRDVSKLLFASDLLATVMNRETEDRGALGLAGYFEPHRDVLAECAPFHKQVGLFEDEAEFVFRASLTAGEDMAAWAGRLAQDFPAARARVLREATACPNPAVRANAATLLGGNFTDDFSADLLKLSLDDADDAVRRAALHSVAKLDRAPLYAEIAARLAAPASHRAAKQAAAAVRVDADRGLTGDAFDACYRKIPLGARADIRSRAWGMRFRDAVSVLPYITLPAALMSGVAAGLFKWLPGVFGWALCQPRPSIMAGLFHGVTAGMIWGGVIALFMLLHRVVFYRKTARLSAVRPVGALVVGVIGGAVSGLTVTLIIVGVFAMTPLAEMGWIRDNTVKQFSAEFWEDLFVNTRYGWAYVITGTWLGLALAIMGNSLRASGQARAGAAAGRVETTKELWAIMKRMMRLALRSAWALPVCLAVAGVMSFNILKPGPSALPHNASVSGRVLGTFFDCGSQTAGGFFSIVGVGVGLAVMTRGVRVEPRGDEL